MLNMCFLIRKLFDNEAEYKRWLYEDKIIFAVQNSQYEIFHNDFEYIKDNYFYSNESLAEKLNIQTDLIKKCKTYLLINNKELKIKKTLSLPEQARFYIDLLEGLDKNELLKKYKIAEENFEKVKISAEKVYNTKKNIQNLLNTKHYNISEIARLLNITYYTAQFLK